MGDPITPERWEGPSEFKQTRVGRAIQKGFGEGVADKFEETVIDRITPKRSKGVGKDDDSVWFTNDSRAMDRQIPDPEFYKRTAVAISHGVHNESFFGRYSLILACVVPLLLVGGRVGGFFFRRAPAHRVLRPTMRQALLDSYRRWQMRNRLAAARAPKPQTPHGAAASRP